MILIIKCSENRIDKVLRNSVDEFSWFIVFSTTFNYISVILW